MPSIGYSSASEARQAREALGTALQALQRDENLPKEVLAIAQNIARSVGALFEAEYASTEVDGKTCIKSALGTLSQTLALMQDVKSEHPEVQAATESIAQVISVLFPLTNKPSVRPDASSSAAPAGSSPPTSNAPTGVASSRPPLQGATAQSAPPRSAPPSTARFKSSPPSRLPSSPPSSRPPSNRPSSLRPPAIKPPSVRPVSDIPRPTGRPATFASSLLPPPPPVPEGARHRIEANLGATTQSNFYVGFSGEIAHGGVFLATYEMLPKDTSVTMLVTLPGGFDFECDGYVRFVRDPLDFASESEPGIGIQFEALPEDARSLVLRFIRNRPPIFYDVS